MKKGPPRPSTAGESDLTAPTTTITVSPLPHGWDQGLTSSSLRTSEALRVQLDGGQFAACTSPSNLPRRTGKRKFVVARRPRRQRRERRKHQWRISTERPTVVPDVVGLLSAPGARSPHSCGDSSGRRRRPPLDPVGQIVEQDPAAGEDVPVGTTVTVVISARIRSPCQAFWIKPRKCGNRAQAGGAPGEHRSSMRSNLVPEGKRLRPERLPVPRQAG